MRLAASLRRDLRHAVRLLAKDPGITVAAVLLIALGVGVGTSVYGMVHAALFRPVPIDRPDRVFELAGWVAYPDYLDFRRQSQAFAGLSAYDIGDLSLGSGRSRESITGALVSQDYFDVLRARMALGRGFVPDEAQPADPLVAVLGHGLWRRRFGADPRVVGRSLELEGEKFTITGVAPAGFRGTVLGSPVEIWVPIAALSRLSPAAGERLYGRRSRWLRAVGRLREGVSAEQAETVTRSLAARLAAENPGEPIDATLIPLAVAASGPESRPDLTRFLGLLMGVVASILLLSCANLANLLSIRALRRSKEMAVRLALGASRGDLARQMLVESLLLGLLGSVLALPVAAGFLQLVQAFELPGKISIGALGLGSTRGMFFVAAGLSLSTALLFGAAPALHALRQDPARELTQQSASSDRRSARLRNALLALQVTLALVLLVTGGLFAKTLRNGFERDLGFASGELAVLPVALPPDKYEGARAAGFFAALLERLEELPGVRAATQVEVLPLGSSRWRASLAVRGRPGEERTVYLNLVGTDYFTTMGIPLLRGRTFDDRDSRGARAAVINETMARHAFPGEEPLGQEVVVFEDRVFEIVGVVRDSVYHDLESPPVPFLFLPYSQDFGRDRLARFVVVRAKDPGGALPRIRSTLQTLDPSVEPYGPDVFTSYVGTVLMPQRFGLRVLGAFGLIALVLTCVGIYSVLMYSVETRTREMAVRLALGARDWNIIQLVAAQAMAPILAGFAAGVLLALGLGRFFARFLHGIGASDPTTFAEVSLLLLMVTLGAALLPALRAARVDVRAGLRKE